MKKLEFFTKKLRNVEDSPFEGSFFINFFMGKKEEP